MQLLGTVAATAGLVIAPSAVANRMDTADAIPWPRAATSSCRSMFERMKNYPNGYWQPLVENRPLSRVAVLRREWLIIHQDGLRAIRAQAPARTRLQVNAVGEYVHMLDTIRRVARTAETGDRRAYNVANVQMALAILKTRRAFAHAGAGHICDFGI
ncbi:MAG: hypothetical protein ACJ74L_01185 [Gaiellaceae bacterium]